MQASNYTGMPRRHFVDLLANGMLRGYKSPGQTGRWNIYRTSLDAYLAKQQAQIEAKEEGNMTTQAQEQDTLTIAEAVTYTGIDQLTLYNLIQSKQLDAAKTGGPARWHITRTSLDAYVAQTREQAEPATQQESGIPERIILPEIILPKTGPVKPANDAQQLQAVISHVFSFLSINALPVGIQAFQEVTLPVRAWEVKTPECTLHVYAQGEHITVAKEQV